MHSNHKRIFLTGMPGSGKSYWGKQLAEVLHCRFIDLDREIERETGRTIPALFGESEAVFRTEEAKNLRRLIAEGEKGIFATGGGTPCFYDNMLLMNHNGITIYLDLTVEKLTANLLRTDAMVSPLFQDKSRTGVSGKLNELLSLREPFYLQSAIIVDAGTVSLPTFAALLKPFL